MRFAKRRIKLATFVAIATFFMLLIWGSYAKATVPEATGQAAQALVNPDKPEGLTDEDACAPQTTITPSPMPAPKMPAVTLYQGSVGISVTELQRKLKELGYFADALSRIYEQSTADAVKEFQRENGLIVNGIASVKLQQLLFSGTANAHKGDNWEYAKLKKDSGGDAVLRLQRGLRGMGYLMTPETGAYDEDTARAVESFQKNNGLLVTGAASAQDQKLLFSGLSEPKYPLLMDGQGLLGSVGKFPSIDVNILNVSRTKTVDSFSVAYVCLNEYGEYIYKYESSIIPTSRFFGKKIPPQGSVYAGEVALTGYPEVKWVLASIFRIHTYDGEMIFIPQEDIIWWFWPVE